MIPIDALVRQKCRCQSLLMMHCCLVSDSLPLLTADSCVHEGGSLASVKAAVSGQSAAGGAAEKQAAAAADADYGEEGGDSGDSGEDGEGPGSVAAAKAKADRAAIEQSAGSKAGGASAEDAGSSSQQGAAGTAGGGAAAAADGKAGKAAAGEGQAKPQSELVLQTLGDVGSSGSATKAGGQSQVRRNCPEHAELGATLVQ